MKYNGSGTWSAGATGMPKITEIVPDDMPIWARKAFDDGQFFNTACKAMNSLEKIREIYAGMDGFIPQTAPEAYQERIIRQMYQCAIDGIIGGV